ncbi:MAG: VCBS repeat-containing protein [Opitutaceae bacterium]|nr:VCBS repeat-containing protein [Opitutaceae bacterium]
MLSSWPDGFGAEPAAASPAQPAKPPEKLVRLAHNNPSAIVDLGVGLWAWPVVCDRNNDGLPDLVVADGSTPNRGTYYFENTGRKDAATGMEIFKKAVYLGPGRNDVTPSPMPDGSVRVTAANYEYPDFLKTGVSTKGKTRKKLPFTAREIHKTSGRVRGEQWSYVDFDGDGKLDLVLGVGDWTDYGWDNAYDSGGRWTNGPLHGFVYIMRNLGTDGQPRYAAPFRLKADGRDIDQYGMPSPVFADFRGTGKLDLICGEFVDGLTFYENTGTREKPEYAPGRRLSFNGAPLTMPLAMIVVTAHDWNKDGRPDLVVAQEDGRVALLENTGNIIMPGRRATPGSAPSASGIPEFKPPRFFRQEADHVKFGVLTAPAAVDWDGDGLVDIVAGNSAGEMAFIKNLGGNPVRWAAPEYLEAGGRRIWIQAGYNGSIQGPCEAKWGYANIHVADWDGDGLPDIMANSIIGKIIWYKNTGTRARPKLAAAQPVRAAWDGPAKKPAWNWWEPVDGELVLQWRCTPYMIDIDGDGLLDLVAPDHEGYLAFFKHVVRDGNHLVLPGRRIFRMRGLSEFDSRGVARADGARDGALRMNHGLAGGSGRRTFEFTDWDGDGKTDLLVNSVNINFYKNVSEKPGEWVFKDMGPVDGRKLAGHSTAPATADWDGDGIPELLAGAEDGFFYMLKNPRAGK